MSKKAAAKKAAPHKKKAAPKAKPANQEHHAESQPNHEDEAAEQAKADRSIKAGPLDAINRLKTSGLTPAQAMEQR